MHKIFNLFIGGVVGIVTGYIIGRGLFLKKKYLIVPTMLFGVCGLIRGYYDKDIVTLLLQSSFNK